MTGSEEWADRGYGRQDLTELKKSCVKCGYTPIDHVGVYWKGDKLKKVNDKN